MLRDAYYELVSGQATASVRYTANGVEREVRYASADRGLLYREWKDAERACGTVEGTARPLIRTIRLIPSKGV
ncbi:hypothetical protein [Methylobacterium sp. A54F]